MNRKLTTHLVIALLIGTSGSALAADKEKPRMPAGGGGKPQQPEGTPTEPAAPAAADETPDGKRRLAGGQVEFVPPAKDAWIESPKNRTATRNAFVSQDRKAMLVVEVLPADQKISADMGPAMVKKLKENRAKSGDKQAKDPAIEKDERFVVRVRERITASDGVAGEQLHLYRAVGPRFVYVLCKTFGGDDKAAGHLEAAEAASLSAEPAGGAGPTPEKPAKAEKPGKTERPTKSGKPAK